MASLGAIGRLSLPPPSLRSFFDYLPQLYSYINRTLTAELTQEVTDDIAFTFNNALSLNLRPEPPS
jgi:hypothetical protein